jgi:centromere protein I
LHAREVSWQHGRNTLRITNRQQDTLTLEEVHDVDSFVLGLEKVELPNQLAAVLADPLLQKLVALRPDHDSNQRIANWISALAQDIVNDDADHVSFAEFLSVLQEYVSTTKVNSTVAYLPRSTR